MCCELLRLKLLRGYDWGLQLALGKLGTESPALLTAAIPVRSPLSLTLQWHIPAHFLETVVD